MCCQMGSVANLLMALVRRLRGAAALHLQPGPGRTDSGRTDAATVAPASGLWLPGDGVVMQGECLGHTALELAPCFCAAAAPRLWPLHLHDSLPSAWAAAAAAADV